MRIIAIFLLGACLSGQTTNCIQFAPFKQVGKLPTNLTSSCLREVSGFEFSRMNPGILWAHSDSSNSNNIAAIRADGTLVQEYKIGTAVNRDWEDITIGKGPIRGRDYIYIADIGDNAQQYSRIRLFRFLEPNTPKQRVTTPIVITDFEVISMRYPNQRHDAETILIDPVDGTPYVLTKELQSGTGYLYQYPMPLDPKNTKTLRLAKTFPHNSPAFSAGDVSQCGRWVIVRDDYRFYTYLRGGAATPFADAFTNKVCTFDASNQGNPESLALAKDQHGLRIYCSSEGRGAPIWESVARLPTSNTGIPSWWSFGSGVESSRWGLPRLAVIGNPAIGRTIAIRLTGAKPRAKAIISLDRIITTVPFASGWAYVSGNEAVMATTDSAGEIELRLGTVPNAAFYHGRRLHAQAAIADSTAKQSIALTPGLTIEFGK